MTELKLLKLAELDTVNSLTLMNKDERSIFDALYYSKTALTAKQIKDVILTEAVEGIIALADGLDTAEYYSPKVVDILANLNSDTAVAISKRLKEVKEQRISMYDRLRQWNTILAKQKVKTLSPATILKNLEVLTRLAFLVKRESDSKRERAYYAINQRVRSLLQRVEEDTQNKKEQHSILRHMRQTEQKPNT